jgi:hypothetical protein
MGSQSHVGRLRVVGVVLAALPAGGCGQVLRHPVPVALMDQAHLPGVPDGVRAWGDQFSPAFQQSVIDSIRQARLAYGDHPPVDVLAISGGGSYGAFGAGLLCGWTARGDRPNFRLVTGVSAGAILAPFVFLGPGYDHQMRTLATTISNDQVFQFKGLLTIFTSDSLTDTAPLAKFLSNFYDADLLRAIAAEHAKGRRLLVATTNLDAQRPVIWDMGAIATVGTPAALQLFRRVILASAAIPVLFPPVYLPVRAAGKDYDEMQVDGGTTAQIALFGDAINVPKLAAIAALPPAPRRPDLYLIRNARLGPEAEAVEPRVADIAGRAVATLTKSESAGELYRIYQVARRDGFAYHLAAIPDGMRLPQGEGFDHAVMQSLFEQGFDLGRAGFPWKGQPPMVEEVDNNLPRVRTQAGTTAP